MPWIIREEMITLGPAVKYVKKLVPTNNSRISIQTEWTETKSEAERFFIPSLASVILNNFQHWEHVQ